MKNLVLIASSLLLASCSFTNQATFTPEYKNQYNELYTVEIPEHYELVLIMMAISEVGQTDSSFMDMTTPYYHEVQQHFKKYENHKMIRKINRKIKKPEHTMSYMHAIVYRTNALAYKINSTNELVYGNILPLRYAFPFVRNPLKKHRKHINSFIRESHFREFYSEHKPFYDSLIQDYKKHVPLTQMVEWLNDKFPDITYNNFTVIASPLIKNPNYTRRFYDTTFQQAIMSVGAHKNNNKEINTGGHRAIFTEVDHNYVNPVSDDYYKRIDETFENLDTWRKEGNLTDAYGSPYKVFNEYMTWGLFSLFALDNYDAQTAKKAIKSSENTMIYYRNFINFEEFNQKLISLYTNNSKITIEEIYETMLTWSENFQPESTNDGD
ncbi:MAG: DUF4932 domain-containing protein [Salinivirgaceae bacterium]|jgi:hypothetical protein|nr:DUF4932 domain-containing protein [Salinivirgaceae bacterium]